MSQEQVKIVVRVYTHLLESESRGWDELDDYIEYLEYLDDDQLHREADALYAKHSISIVGCNQKHPKEKCFMPVLLEAVGAILDLYKEKNNLHEKNKYILQYYIAMTQAEMIVIESSNVP